MKTKLENSTDLLNDLLNVYSAIGDKTITLEEAKTRATVAGRTMQVVKGKMEYNKQHGMQDKKIQFMEN